MSSHFGVGLSGTKNLAYHTSFHRSPKRKAKETGGAPCEICGSADTRYQDRLLTCKCGAREHMCNHLPIYCMQSPLSKVPKVWVCGDCHPLKSIQPSCSIPATLTKHYAPQDKKVKYMSIEKVMRLSERVGCGSTAQSRGLSIPSKIKYHSERPQKPCRKSKNFVPETPIKVRTRLAKPAQRGDVVSKVHPASEARKGKSVDGSKVLFDSHLMEEVLGQKPLETVPEEAPMDVDLPRIEPGGDSHVEPQGCQQLTDLNIPEISLSRRSTSPSILSEVASWTGRFVFSDPAIAGDHYGQFEAYPTSKVHSPSYELAGFLLEDVVVDLIPLDQLPWGLFQLRSWDLLDAGLFILPDCVNDRSARAYRHLLKLMETRNSAIRISIVEVEGLELLLFTSKQLHVDALCKLPAWREFLWGSIAGAFGEGLMHPIDSLTPVFKVKQFLLIRSNCQNQKNVLQMVRIIWSGDGLKGLYRGVTPGLTGSFATYFGFIESTKKWIDESHPSLGGHWSHFIAGAMGDTPGSFVYVPCEVMKQRMQVQGAKHSWSSVAMKDNASARPGGQRYYRGIFHAGRSIWMEQGLKGLYTVFCSTLARDVPFSGLMVMFYESLKDLTEYGRQKLAPKLKLQH